MKAKREKVHYVDNHILYLKQHNETGLKYLGKTIKDPYKYKGSGTRWLNHLKVHGNNVSTRILRECKSNAELKQWGLIYSRLFNVVEDKNFANLKPEEGEGGGGMLGKKHSIETKLKMSRSSMGKSKGPLTEEHKQKLSQNSTRHWLNTKFTEKHKLKLKLSHEGIFHSEEQKRKISKSMKSARQKNNWSTKKVISNEI